MPEATDGHTTRRRLLASAAAAIAGGIAGCSGSGGQTAATTETTTEATTTTKTTTTKTTTTETTTTTATTPEEQEVLVGPNGKYRYSPGTEEPARVKAGTTVRFVWDSGGHNVHVDQKPDGSDWTGHEDREPAGFEHTHTFETTGEYRYWCTPHKSLGMIGTLIVE